MVRSILVGLDGSPYSEAAVDLGLRWAKRFDALLIGLGVIDEPEITKPEAIPLGAGSFKSQRDAAVLADARRRVEQLLDHFAGRCTDAGVACKLLEDVGRPFEQIRLEAQRYDLILLGKETFFNFQSSEQPDETLGKILRSSPRPVVAVPERLPDDGPVLIAYDGSLQAARTLAAFQSLLARAAEPIHLVAAHADSVEAARRADRALEYLAFHGIKATPHAIACAANPAAAILDQAQRLGAGLLVMGAYGQPVVREFFFGSVTRTLLKEKTAPLFLFH